MSLFILDTNTLTLLQDGHPKIVARVAERAPDEIAVSVISVEEQLSGWYRRLRRSQQPNQLAKFYDRLTDAVRYLYRLPLLSFSESAIVRARNLQKSRLIVGKLDLCIAATALEENATVVTQNVRDFQRVPGLAVADWST